MLAQKDGLTIRLKSFIQLNDSNEIINGGYDRLDIEAARVVVSRIPLSEL